MTSRQEAEPLRREELESVFREAEKPASEFRIGAESEKFGVSSSGAPLGYEGEFGVCRVFAWLTEEHGWTPFREREGGPILGLKRDGASITLEPGAQLELSGAPQKDMHGVAEELTQHLREIAPVSAAMGLSWLFVGFHPFAKLEELPWVPKQRYPVMRRYLPTRGPAALDMMQRSATVQANFDWSSERDAMRKMRVALRLSPFLQAFFSNAPFKEGARSELSSERGRVWLHMDPSRSGLIPPFWRDEEPTYEDYVEWSLDAGMFLFRRGDKFIENTGQTFRDFLQNGFEGHRATWDDYRLHLTTLFPEVRLKNTLEVRSADSVPPAFADALVALWTGVLYDPRALDEAWELTAPWSLEEVEAARPGLVRAGLHEPFLGSSGWELAERLVEIGRGGLERRARRDERGEDETRFLRPLSALIERRRHPADLLIEAANRTGSLLEATRTDLSALLGG